VANEQLFSAASQIYVDRRTSLAGENAETTVIPSLQHKTI